MERLINHSWAVMSRLLIHRDEGVGYNTQGRAIAMAIKGIPRYDGLANWSKKLVITVSLSVQFCVFQHLMGLVHLVWCGLRFWLG